VGAVPTTDPPPPSTAEVDDGAGWEGESFCLASGTFDTAFPQIDPALGDPARLEEALDQASKEVEEVTRSAPEEIRADAEVLAQAFRDLLGALERVDYDFTRLSLQALASLDAPEVQAAQQRLEAYCSRGG
jgi:hypothetical protein